MSDYISREAAFNAVLKLIPKVDDDGYCWVIRGDAATAIDNIPAADVRPVVQGKWKRDYNRNGRSNWQTCSACHAFIPLPSWRIENWNFCPNCGADMMEES